MYARAQTAQRGSPAPCSGPNPALPTGPCRATSEQLPEGTERTTLPSLSPAARGQTLAPTCASRRGLRGSQARKAERERTDLGETVQRPAPRTPGRTSAGAVPLRLAFRCEVSSRPLGRREEPGPAESARRGGLQAAGAKGRREGREASTGGEAKETKTSERSQGERGRTEEPRTLAQEAAQAGIARPCILEGGGRAGVRAPRPLRDRGASAAHRSCCRGPSKSNASWRARVAGRRRTAGRARCWAPGARRWPGWRG